MKKLLVVHQGYTEEFELAQDIIETEDEYIAKTNESKKFNAKLDEEMRPYDLNTTKLRKRLKNKKL